MQTVVRLRFCTAVPISPSFWEQCMAIHTFASPISWTIMPPCSCRTCSALTWSFIWRLWHVFGAGSFWIPQVLLFTSTAAVLFVFYPFFFLLTFCCYRCPDCRCNVSVFFFPTGQGSFSWSNSKDYWAHLSHSSSHLSGVRSVDSPWPCAATCWEGWNKPTAGYTLTPAGKMGNI